MIREYIIMVIMFDLFKYFFLFVYYSYYFCVEMKLIVIIKNINWYIM